MALEGLLDDLDRAVDALVAGGAGDLADHELRGMLQRLTTAERRLEGARLAAVGQLRDRAAAAGRSEREVRDLVQRTAATTPGAAKAVVATAGLLAQLPRTRAALERGDIGADKAAIIARAAETVDDEGRELIDRTGATVAAVCNERQLRRSMTETRYRLAPDDLRERERRAIANRRLSLHDTPDGMVRGEFLLPVHHAEPVRTVLDAFSHPRVGADDRTHAQRQADALVEVCRRTLDRGESHDGGFLPHMTVTVSAETLQGAPGAPPATLAFGGAVSAETARQLGCNAAVARVVLGPGSTIIDVGRARRTATLPQRRALLARDGGCVGCGAPPGWCQAHHVRWWRHGGRTDIDNLVLVCSACHDKIHHASWQVVRDRSGRRRLRPPSPDPPAPTTRRPGVLARA